MGQVGRRQAPRTTSTTYSRVPFCTSCSEYGTVRLPWLATAAQRNPMPAFPCPGCFSPLPWSCCDLPLPANTSSEPHAVQHAPWFPAAQRSSIVRWIGILADLPWWLVAPFLSQRARQRLHFRTPRDDRFGICANRESLPPIGLSLELAQPGRRPSCPLPRDQTQPIAVLAALSPSLS